MTIERSTQTGPYAEGWNARLDADKSNPEPNNPYPELSSERMTWGGAWSDCDWRIQCGRNPAPHDSLTPDVLPSGNPPKRTIDLDLFRFWDDGFRVYARPLPPNMDPRTVLVFAYKQCDYPGAAHAAVDALFQARERDRLGLELAKSVLRRPHEPGSLEQHAARRYLGIEEQSVESHREEEKASTRYVGWCPQCGPVATYGEDGCCKSCGGNASGAGAAAAAVMKSLERVPDDQTEHISYTTNWRDRMVYIRYTNWRGKTADRRIRPIFIYFGANEWHPDPQWLLRAHDLDKDAERDFAMNGILSSWSEE